MINFIILGLCALLYRYFLLTQRGEIIINLCGDEMNDQQNYWVPELLAPAGSFEKFKTALLYGADALYLAGQKFGLRNSADNFTSSELQHAVKLAHQHKSAVFVVLNSFGHDQDLQEMPLFLTEIDQLGVDAVIVSDLGVMEMVKKYTTIPIHLSTQASCLNVEAAKVWKEMGATRLVLGREISLADAQKIKQEVGVEIELFVHGSMCMAYSGNCVISNYTQGRDSNRGGCAHSCRFDYEIDFLNEQQQKQRAYFMSSKDLMGLRRLQDYINAGVDSLKIEGRMKGPHYAGTVTKVYREALDFYRLHGHFYSEDLQKWESELRKVSHRDYTEASLLMPAEKDSIYYDRHEVVQDYQVAGIVLEAKKDEYTLIEVRASFEKGDRLELIPFRGESVVCELDSLVDSSQREIERTRPGTLVKIPYIKGACEQNLLRKKVQKCGAQWPA